MVTMMGNVVASYERFDSCYAVVTSRCNKGAFLRLDNGEEAFAYRFGNLFPDSEVLCTVLKPADGYKKMLVSIDSVISYSYRAS